MEVVPSLAGLSSLDASMSISIRKGNSKVGNVLSSWKTKRCTASTRFKLSIHRSPRRSDEGRVLLAHIKYFCRFSPTSILSAERLVDQIPSTDTSLNRSTPLLQALHGNFLFSFVLLELLEADEKASESFPKTSNPRRLESDLQRPQPLGYSQILQGIFLE